MKVTTLVKYDSSKLKRAVFSQIEQVAGNKERMQAAEKSFNEDNYKVVRILAFGEELCKKVSAKLGVPGIVVAFSNLLPLDFSNNSGQSLRLETEEQFFTIGKSAEYIICKGQ